SAGAKYIRGMQRRRGTTRQPLETSWGNQPQGQDLPRFPSPKAITQANWSEGDTPYGVFRDPVPFLEETGDDVFAFAVEFLGLIVRTLREPARAVRNIFHHQLRPLPFRGPPRKATIASATCFSESFLLRTSSGKRPAR